MLRSILAIILSYILMVALIIGAFMGLWMGLGINRLLEPGTFEGNMLLCIAAPSITLIAGLIGGWMCTKIARAKKPALALAALVLALGMAQAYVTLQKPLPTGARDPNMTMEEFMKVGREPTWIALFNPIGGAVAVLVGGFVVAKPRKTK